MDFFIDMAHMLGIFLAFGLFITAIYALVHPEKIYFGSKDKSRIALSSGYFLAGFFAFMIVGYTANDEPYNKHDASYPPQKTAITEPKKPKERLSYKSVRSNIEKLTDLQFQEYASTIEGQILEGTFYISDVKAKMFGGYRVSLDYDNPKSMSIAEIEFDADKSFAMSLKKNQRIQCSGMIESVTAVMGIAMIDLEDVSPQKIRNNKCQIWGLV